MPLTVGSFAVYGELVDVVVDEIRSHQTDGRAVGVIGPSRRRHRLRHVVQVHAVRQLRLALVERGCRVGERSRRSRGHDVLVQGSRNDRAVQILGNRKVDEQIEVRRVRSGGSVPAAKRERVSLGQQECVGERLRVRDRAGIVAREAAIEHAEGLCSAVDRVVHHLVVALARIDRLQDVERMRILDLAGGVARRELDIDDDRILGVVRIEFAVRHADELFVLANDLATSSRRTSAIPSR